MNWARKNIRLIAVVIVVIIAGIVIWKILDARQKQLPTTAPLASENTNVF